MTDGQFTFAQRSPSRAGLGHTPRPIIYQRRSSGGKSFSDVKTPSKPSHSNNQVLRSVSSPIAQSAPSSQLAEPQKKFLTRKKLTITFTSISIIAFIAGAALGLSNLKLDKQTQNKVEALSQQTTTDGSEVAPSSNDLANYSVAPDLARILTISKINVKARVMQVGVDSSNTLLAPPNIYDAGWYTGSAKPGQKGAMVIDGHVHGPTKPGIFMNLDRLESGDNITIEKGDHKIIKYKVVKTKVYDINHVDMTAVMTPISTKQNGLNLITCTGPFDAKTGNYTQRLVVFAVQQT